MKKRSILKFVFVSLGVVLGLSSCNKCQICSDGFDTYSVCQDEFATKSIYKAYIKTLELRGYICR